MLVLAHNVWTILSGHFDASDPFIHVMAETIGSAAAGAILSVVLGLVHRRFLQRM
jgi:NhaP-type Na+/H+ or K+/H+ antiporter